MQSSGKGSFVRYGNCALATILHLLFVVVIVVVGQVSIAREWRSEGGEKLQTAASSNGETTTSLFQAVSTESLMFSLITSRCEIITKSVR